MDSGAGQEYRQTERRSSPRIAVEALFNGVLTHGSLHVVLHDLGFGGFSVQSPVAFAIGSRHEFRFVTSTGVTALLSAETVYTRPLGPRDGMQHHLSGFKYLLTTPDVARTVDLLFDAAMAPLSFED